MKRPRLRAFRLVPLPCEHEIAGHPHATPKELRECILKNGPPKVDYVEEEWARR